MNVLIIYPFYNQRDLIHNFAVKLAKGGVSVDSICYINFHFEKSTSIKWPKSFLSCTNVFRRIKFDLIARGVRYIVKRYLIPQLFLKYDLIDFHGYYPVYNSLMQVCVEKGYKFDITLWGSDLMRADDKRKERLKYGFNHCYRIKMTSNLYDTMVQYYGSIYADKYREVYFGSNELEQIDAIDDNKTLVIRKQLYGDIGNKMILVCGYNGIRSQNHDKMIAALCNLDKDEKESVHVVLPMTYGTKPEYLESIRSKMEQIGMSYTILDHFLDAKEVAVIRKTAHIAINVQNTDASSDSLKGHLYCGNVCIFGEWLNYDIFCKNDICYIKTMIGDISTHLKEVLQHYDEYHHLCEGNPEKVKKLFSWESTIKTQVAVYGE